MMKINKKKEKKEKKEKKRRITMEKYEEKMMKVETEEYSEDCIDEISTADEVEVENFNVQQFSVGRADSLNAYMKDIARFPRLTKEQEIELGKRKDAGDKDARKQLINCNMRLVAALAKRKFDAISSSSSISITLEDLIQEGALGLITAVDKYDWTKNCKFSTNAVYWINQAIIDAITNNGRTIRLPAHKVKEISVIRRAINELSLVLEHTPTISEVSAYLNFKFTEAEITNLLTIINNTTMVSLNTPINDNEDDGEMGDFVADQTVETPTEYTNKSALHRSITEAIQSLPEKERLVVQYSFGFNDCEETTLEEISSILYKHGYTNRDGKQLTRESIRLLREKALGMLKPLINY